MRFPRHWLSVAASSLLAAAGAAGAQQPAAAAGPTGWMITTKMSIDSGNGSTPVTMTTKTAMADKKMRMEYTASSIGGGMLQGAAMIVSVPDSTVTNIMPSQQMAMVMPMSLMTIGSTMIKRAPTLTTDSVEDLGAGPAIAGHATHHVRRTSIGSLQITLPDGGSCEQPINTVSEMWLAPDIDPDSAVAGITAMLGGAGAPGMTGFDDLLKQSRAKLPKGYPLKAIGTMHTTQNGQPQTVTMTSEVTDITHGPIEASNFAVPLGYQTMDVAAMAAMSGQDITASVKQMAAQAAARLCAKAP